MTEAEKVEKKMTKLTKMVYNIITLSTDNKVGELKGLNWDLIGLSVLKRRRKELITLVISPTQLVFNHTGSDDQEEKKNNI